MSNQYYRFLKLLPNTIRRVGKVINVNQNSARVKVTGGGECMFYGSAKVGSMVYVEGDQIIGEAPSLPVVTIEV